MGWERGASSRMWEKRGGIREMRRMEPLLLKLHSLVYISLLRSGGTEPEICPSSCWQMSSASPQRRRRKMKPQEPREEVRCEGRRDSQQGSPTLPSELSTLFTGGD